MQNVVPGLRRRFGTPVGEACERPVGKRARRPERPVRQRHQPGLRPLLGWHRSAHTSFGPKRSQPRLGRAGLRMEIRFRVTEGILASAGRRSDSLEQSPHRVVLERRLELDQLRQPCADLGDFAEDPDEPCADVVAHDRLRSRGLAVEDPAQRGLVPAA